MFLGKIIPWLRRKLQICWADERDKKIMVKVKIIWKDYKPNFCFPLNWPKFWKFDKISTTKITAFKVIFNIKFDYVMQRKIRVLDRWQASGKRLQTKKMNDWKVQIKNISRLRSSHIQSVNSVHYYSTK